MQSENGRLRILKDAKNKLDKYNRQYRKVREYYLDVLRACENNRTLVEHSSDISVESIGMVEKALRHYLGMARVGVMEENENGSFTERLKGKLESDAIKASLKKLRGADILSAKLNEHKPDARQLYECLAASGRKGLAADGNSFCVGATKIMHCLFPEFFVMVDSVMAQALYDNGYRSRKGKYNNFTTFWDEAMQACHDELQAWCEIYGNVDSLLKLDTERPTTLVRIFDKCRRYSLKGD